MHSGVLLDLCFALVIVIAFDTFWFLFRCILDIFLAFSIALENPLPVLVPLVSLALSSPVKSDITGVATKIEE